MNRTLRAAAAAIMLALMVSLPGPTVRATGGQPPSAETCAGLAGAQLAITDESARGDVEQGGVLAKRIRPSITSARLVPVAGAVPEYCRVEGTIPTGDPQEGTNQVRFAVNLPTQWNGRFVMIGDGGFDGAVSGSTARLPEGYATANSDMGHDGRAFGGGSFGFNNRPREIDYGWRATHVTTVVAKGIIDAYYDRRPRYSYWEGCSTGGRQAAVEAQRFPDDFDGIVSGDPFMNAIEIAMEQVWSSAIFFRDVNKDGVGFDNNISQADIDALRDAVLAKCDVLGNDRVRDRVVGNPLACAKVFTEEDIDDLGHARGLSPGQIQAIKDVYRGPHDSSGQRRWYKGKPLGSEFSWGSLVVPTPANGFFPGQGGFSWSSSITSGSSTTRAFRPRAGTIRRCCRHRASTVGSTSTSTATRRTAAPGSPVRMASGSPRRRRVHARDPQRHRYRPRLPEAEAGRQVPAVPRLRRRPDRPEPTIDYYDGIVKETFGGHRRKGAGQRAPVPGARHGPLLPAASAARRWAGTSSRRWSRGWSRASRRNRSW